MDMDMERMMFGKKEKTPARVRFSAGEPAISQGRVFYPVMIKADTESRDYRMHYLNTRVFEVFESRNQAVAFADEMNARELTTDSPEWRGCND
ncbi:MAG: hypothetical protein CMH91_15050 [Oceanicaulis sp.]|nr:hypothetical protein [Oceanicaulis sp.]MBC40363.1 hypothetical protein [Oceanicaulis sp.]MBG37339.1 hypothetical protein [Oceanicaulis sp.]HBU62427.1 hypothetical protein [Oceanicaulis sp.]HCR94697.1 hypothetical protein [Oceanicaulis sp.]|tara:strand:+ start:269 stop:547 length:279 start_codon:yes stop_codon:yes gene_type:complete